jgi:hypothetical protein
MMDDFPVMRGNAAMARGASYFEVPLFSHIIDNLWMGCSPAEFPDTAEADGLYYSHYAGSTDKPVKCKWLMEYDSVMLADQRRFDRILNLYQWGEYEVPKGTQRVTVEMYDGLEAASEQVDALSDLVIKWLNEHCRVLVHCQAGLNRSSLVVARVLMKKYEMTADEAIAHIRSQRSPMCLCNDNFRQFLKGLV